MYSYDVKVLPKNTSLWGGVGIEKAISSNSLLICRNDELGVSLKLFTKNQDDGAVPFGTLAPGETYIFRLNEVTLIGAKTTDDVSDSMVRCTIVCPQSN
ncbi:hypothetical protein [Gimesia fumaroli]|uniref:Uncharacterized protein n=1 Tax=Gimesia fumaroli TaxID=2527976 RepID=A0A518I4T6_9PLAN|nr:hypothetical protein [Gimesia fumaroli]QDV48110.1 hypothetical protein Enr17x_01190 [Gimesia fumaroli]